MNELNWVKVSNGLPEDNRPVAIVDSSHGEIYSGAIAIRRGPHLYLMGGVSTSSGPVHLDIEATHWAYLNIPKS